VASTGRRGPRYRPAADDPVAKQIMLAIAEKYRELAERAEGRGEKDNSS
jgi:hypothetical protein